MPEMDYGLISTEPERRTTSWPLKRVLLARLWHFRRVNIRVTVGIGGALAMASGWGGARFIRSLIRCRLSSPQNEPLADTYLDAFQQDQEDQNETLQDVYALRSLPAIILNTLTQTVKMARFGKIPTKSKRTYVREISRCRRRGTYQ